MITITQKGDFKNTEKFLNRAQKLNYMNILNKYGAMGVSELAKATPKDSGITAASWDFNIELQSGGYTINWFNTHTNNGVVIAILIQYGHGTGNGGYVQPRDYINPAMKPIFEKMAEDIWKEVITS